MICSKCGYSIEKGWKYCPNCSRNINKKRNIIIFSTITVLLILCIIIPFVKNNMPMNDKYLEKELEKKYNENFENVTLIKSVKNPDTDLNCDGSSFGTIKGKGTKEYYKLYSKKNNLEFWAYYDTSDKSKKIVDNYNMLLNRRSTIKNVYDYIISNFSNSISKITISYNLEDIETDILSINQLNTFLNNVEKENTTPNYFDTMYDKVNIYINENIFDYSKSNYKIIDELNDKFIELKDNYYFSVILKFNNNAHIELDRLDGKAYVYDKFGNNYAWGETLDDFIKRDNY